VSPCSRLGAQFVVRCRRDGTAWRSGSRPDGFGSERITMVVLLNSGVDVPGSWVMMQDITRIISPDHPWPNLPKK
jgi:hypothetical protein